MELHSVRDVFGADVHTDESKYWQLIREGHTIHTAVTPCELSEVIY
jgi:hypothetical protein